MTAPRVTPGLHCVAVETWPWSQRVLPDMADVREMVADALARSDVRRGRARVRYRDRSSVVGTPVRQF